MNNVLNAPYARMLNDPCDMLFIVGEPGMGKTAAARAYLRRLYNSAKIEQLILNNSSVNLQAQIERLKHNVSMRLRKRTRERVAVLIDGFPVAEEDALMRSASHLRALNSQGCAVVVTLRPEAEELLEYLPEGRVVRGADLVYGVPSPPDELALSVYKRTNGIPALVACIESEEDQSATHFFQCLNMLVELSLRGGIPQAEREVRAAMMLLGHGTLAELAEVVHGADDETLAWLESEAPLFGIHTFGGTFACASLVDDVALRRCHATLRRLPDSFTEMECRVVDLLLARRDYVRAGICCSIIAPSDRRARVALRQGAELALSGAALVVSDAVREANLLGMQEEPGFATSRAMLQVLQEPYEAARFAHTRLGVGRHVLWHSVGMTHVTLAMAARSLDAGQGFKFEPYGAPDALSETLLEHVAVRGLLLEGKPTQAMERISAHVLPETPATVPDALMIGDVLIAHMLCSRTVPTDGSEWAEGACALLETSRLRRLATYARALRDVLAVLAGGTSTTATSRAIHEAGHADDQALRAALLIVEGVADLRRAAPAKAHVCFAHASALALGPSFGRLREWSLLLDALTLTAMGEEGTILKLLGNELGEGVVKDIVRLLVMAHCDYAVDASLDLADDARGALVSETSEITTLSLTHVDRDALWLVCIIASDFGSISAQFKKSLPAVWLHALSCYGGFSGGNRDMSQGTSADVAPSRSSEPNQTAGEPTGSVAQGIQMSVEHQKPVRISLLGGLRVVVNGRSLVPTQVNRRRAHLLLALLSAHEGHAMRRAELVDDIWGQEIMEVGLQRLYEATSTARTVLGAREQGFDPFLTRRGKEVIALDPNYVEFDIDELEHVAHACISRDERDEDVIDDACRARELYVGDLDTKTLLGLPWAQHRCDYLRELFVDAMVAGARSALRLGRVRVALALARSGVTYGDLREDVMAALVRSLVAAGRPGEARTLFEGFSFRMTRSTGAPPSNDLRRLVAELCPVGHESGAVTKIYDGKIGRDVNNHAEGNVGFEGLGGSAANTCSGSDTGSGRVEGDVGGGGEFEHIVVAAA